MNAQQPTANSQQPTAGSQQRAAGSGQPTAGSGQPDTALGLRPRRTRCPVRLLFAFLVALITVTGLAKAWLLAFHPFPDLAAGIPLWALWLAVLLESGLLLIALWPRIPFEFKMGAFFSFFACAAIYSGWRTMTGAESCGCAGALDIPPWPFFVLDLMIVASLIHLRKSWFDAAKIRGFLFRPDVVGATAGCFLVIGLLVFSQTSVGSELADRFMRGYSVTARTASFGVARGTESREVDLVLKNRAKTPARIIGFRASCSCVVPDQSAFAVIPAGGELSLPIAVTPEKRGRFHQRVLFYLDTPRQFVVAADITGFVQEK